MAKNLTLTIRLSAEEKLAWEEASSGCGLTIGEFIRRTMAGALLFRPVVMPMGPEKIIEECQAGYEKPARGKKGELCVRCARIGSPSCEGCRKVNAESVVEE